MDPPEFPAACDRRGLHKWKLERVKDRESDKIEKQKEDEKKNVKIERACTKSEKKDDAQILFLLATAVKVSNLLPPFFVQRTTQSPN